METKWIVGAVLAVVVVISGLMYGIPIYNVWSAGKAGQALLQHADFERQVQVVNAQANLQAQNITPKQRLPVQEE